MGMLPPHQLTLTLVTRQFISPTPCCRLLTKRFLQSEVGLKFPCSLCSHVANFPGTLKRHMRSEHNPFISAFKKRKEEEAEAEGGGVSNEAERLAPRDTTSNNNENNKNKTYFVIKYLCKNESNV